MNHQTRTALAELNHAFYTQFADDFARTRRTWPPGCERILPYLRPGANVVDLGCGNGRFLRFLVAHGWLGTYVGVDNSPGLLEIAAGEMGRGPTRTNADETTEGSPIRAAVDANGPIQASFIQADLLDPNWPTRLGDLTPDVIVAIAVLHHIPGSAQRARFVADCARLLPEGGLLILTTWQFMTSPRLRARVLPWKTVGLTNDDVEPGDYLLAWGPGATGRRYCAFIDADTLCGLAARAGLTLIETYYADGHEGNLNLYGMFRKGDQA
ncbi:MAG: hypothetical protein AUK03_05010 [Anaerolineae bacterium CG2_30_64_16]|nr:MAG: hypothetical protein AUK03_05010 [Anaerolineae bacterium CG2_30_64_16]